MTVGVIGAPHGIRGEVKVEPLTDFPERFEAGSMLWLRGAPVRVERGRWQGRALVLKLAGIETRSQAEALRGSALEAEPLASLDEGVYYRDDLIGLAVVDIHGETLGRLVDILATGSNDVYVVRAARGELLLPATDDVIKEIDLARKTVTVDVAEGLEWVANARPRRPKAARPRPRTSAGAPSERQDAVDGTANPS